MGALITPYRYARKHEREEVDLDLERRHERGGDADRESVRHAEREAQRARNRRVDRRDEEEAHRHEAWERAGRAVGLTRPNVRGDPRERHGRMRRADPKSARAAVRARRRVAEVVEQASFVAMYRFARSTPSDANSRMNRTRRSRAAPGAAGPRRALARRGRFGGARDGLLGRLAVDAAVVVDGGLLGRRARRAARPEEGLREVARHAEERVADEERAARRAGCVPERREHLEHDARAVEEARDEREHERLALGQQEGRGERGEERRLAADRDERVARQEEIERARVRHAEQREAEERAAGRERGHRAAAAAVEQDLARERDAVDQERRDGEDEREARRLVRAAALAARAHLGVLPLLFEHHEERAPPKHDAGEEEHVRQADDDEQRVTLHVDPSTADLRLNLQACSPMMRSLALVALVRAGGAAPSLMWEEDIGPAGTLCSNATGRCHSFAHFVFLATPSDATHVLEGGAQFSLDGGVSWRDGGAAVFESHLVAGTCEYCAGPEASCNCTSLAPSQMFSWGWEASAALEGAAPPPAGLCARPWLVDLAEGPGAARATLAPRCVALGAPSPAPRPTRTARCSRDSTRGRARRRGTAPRRADAAARTCTRSSPRRLRRRPSRRERAAS